jgi:hypothetical protein
MISLLGKQSEQNKLPCLRQPRPFGLGLCGRL